MTKVIAFCLIASLYLSFVASGCGGGGLTDIERERKEDRQTQTSLMKAVEMDDIDAASQLLKTSQNFKQVNEKGYGLLHMARSKGMVELLVNAGADINFLGSNPEINGSKRSLTSPLYDHALNNRRDIVEYLISKAADPHVGEIPAIFGAVYANNEALVKRLAKAGADLTQTDLIGMNPLSLAIDISTESMVKTILGIDNSLINIAAPDFPIDRAIRKKDKALIKTLTSFGADINDYTFERIVSDGDMDMMKSVLSLKPSLAIKPKYLIEATQKHQADVALFLLQQDVKLTGLETDLLNPKSALFIAADKGLDNVVKAIVDKEKGKGKNTSLLLGEYRGEEIVIAALLKAGVDPNGIAKDDMPLLHYIALNVSTVVSKNVMQLVNQGADVNLQFTVKGILHNDSPLHLAVYNGNHALTKYLLENGATPSLALLNNVEGSPLHVVAHQSNAAVGAKADALLDIARLLLKKGASKTMRNASNRTPWDLITIGNPKHGDYQNLLQ